MSLYMYFKVILAKKLKNDQRTLIVRHRLPFKNFIIFLFHCKYNIIQGLNTVISNELTFLIFMSSDFLPDKVKFKF